MLELVKAMHWLQFSQLMQVYQQSNEDNAREFYAHLPSEQGMLNVQQDFYQYLREIFFKTPEAVYALWVEDGRYVSALRLEPYRDGLLLAALETVPDLRGRGYAKQLVAAAIAGAQKVYAHVGKRNLASLRVHESCGFQRISEQAVYIDGSVNSHCCTMCYIK